MGGRCRGHRTHRGGWQRIAPIAGGPGPDSLVHLAAGTASATPRRCRHDPPGREPRHLELDLRTATRRTAGTLLTDEGYPATILDQVAQASGAAADTVLHIFDRKKGLLRAVLDITIAGDDEEVTVLDRASPQAMRRETDPRCQVAMLAAGVTGQLERIRPVDDILRSAAVVDADARALRDDIQHVTTRSRGSYRHLDHRQRRPEERPGGRRSG